MFSNGFIYNENFVVYINVIIYTIKTYDTYIILLSLLIVKLYASRHLESDPDKTQENFFMHSVQNVQACEPY